MFLIRPIGPIAGAALLAVALGAGCKPEAAALAKTAAPKVTVAHPLTKEVVDYEYYPNGRLQAIESVEVKARVSGYLEKVLFTPGTEVAKGTALFEIDKRPYQATLDRAVAQLERDEATVKRAEADYRRSVDLFRRGTLSREEFDKAEADFSAAKAAGAADKAAIDQAKLDLEFCTVVAPITGRISREQITPGNLVTAGATGSPTLTTLVSQDPIYVYFNPSERDVLRFLKERVPGEGIEPSKLRAANIPVELGLADEENTYPYKGVIDFADNQIDPSTGTLSVRARFDNPKRLLTPGLFARVRSPQGKPHDSLLVPDAAIGADQEIRYLWVVDDQGNVSRRDQKSKPDPLVLGDRQGPLREVKGGLKAGEWVIVNGVQRARDGGRVDPVRATIDDAGNVVPEKKDETKGRAGATD